MFVDFNEMPDVSRVWIYQANREFTEAEVSEIGAKLEQFVSQWVRHGDDLKGSYTIKYNQFIVLAVDESFNNVSGCSIDSSVNAIKQIEQAFQVDLMNKMNITFKVGENINILSLADFQNYAKEGKITAETIVFNNMVQTKQAFETEWEVEASKSWHQRFIPAKVS
ncbi:ABC transporter ATPase [Aureivirga sp. CE67]|uniref:ABC transporter ATPase n=1 Tax=Aureivirga sp. CE67 TaxID=1788983 RepID=UPI0018CB5F05|nr:ABC transporter ATPase [Aureivirga sp. CE67]